MSLITCLNTFEEEQIIRQLKVFSAHSLSFINLL